MGNNIGKDTLEFTKGMVLGGTTLTLGSSVVAKLPSTPATSGVQQGFTTAAGFFPTFGAIGAAGITFKQLNNLKGRI